jgi:hypothetical protein
MHIFQIYFCFLTATTTTQEIYRISARHLVTGRVIAYPMRFSSVRSGTALQIMPRLLTLHPFTLLLIHDHAIQAVLLTAPLNKYKHIPNADTAQQRVTWEDGHEEKQLWIWYKTVATSFGLLRGDSPALNEENRIMLSNSQQPNTDSTHTRYERNVSGNPNVHSLLRRS